MQHRELSKRVTTRVADIQVTWFDSDADIGCK